jgi:hypothetical protein
MTQQTMPQETMPGEAIQDQTCPKCAMPKREWRGNGGQGYILGGLIYCCRGCAEDNGCICR